MSESEEERQEPARKPRSQSKPKGDDWSGGTVRAAEVRQGAENSDSVRRVQRRLSKLDELPKELKPEVTGNWDARTRSAVRWWQNNHGYVGGRGINPSHEQLEKLLGSGYNVREE